MPYATVAALPDSTDKLPAHAKEIYMNAFNSAYEQYDGDEPKSHATAWSAVEKSYVKRGDSWVAKESSSMSNEDKKAKLQAALISEYGLTVESPIPKKVTVEAVYESHFIYAIDGQFYKASFELGEAGDTKLGQPEKVLSTKIYPTMESLSMENRRTILDSALNTRFAISKDQWLWIEDMTETEVFYNQDRQAYKVSYSIADDHIVTLGDPTKVARQVIFNPIESLQRKYSELIMEAGKRNAITDSGRIKRIVELCQELLSSEAPDEKMTKEAISEATAVLAEIKKQPAVKMENGLKFPASAYAYTPESDNPDTWKLLMWEDLEKKVTKNALRLASAFLSTGGNAGKKLALPEADLSVVKRKLRAEYRKLEVADSDIPKWVNETMIRDKYPIYTPLTEAKAFDDKGRATVIVIKAGFNADKSRYYPAEVLKRDYGIFEGQKMFADHPTPTEEKELPERSMKSSGFVAKLVDVTCDENGTVTGVADIVEDWLMRKLANMRDKQMLSEMGISINALGRGSKATIEGVETLVIEELTGARSVDFVTEPGANGIVTLYESADRNLDIDLVELSGLREKRPDLVEIIESSVRAEITEEVKKLSEQDEKIKELEGQNDTLTTENTGLKTKIEEAEKAESKRVAQDAIKEAVDASELPTLAKEKIIERFKDVEVSEGIAEAIEAEKTYIAGLTESGKPRNMGTTGTDTEASTKALRESLKRANPDWTDVQLDAAVAGR